ncbi:MAG: diaminopimelate epimerase [Ignavibacteria bacterium]
MKKIFFSKMSGAGNDFVVFDFISGEKLLLSEDSIKKICNRRTGIGADGVITFSKSNGHDFNMNYYNADGSTGSLCGNGARCAIWYAELTGKIKNHKANFSSNDELYSGEVLNEEMIQFNFNEPKQIKLNFKIKANNQEINCSFIDTGSPHVVIKASEILKNPGDRQSSYNEINQLPVVSIGREIRYLNDFAPKGTNVNFIQYKGPKILIRTYERGVEDETLACGTGNAASAITACLTDNINPPVSLITKGGDELIVNFSKDGQRIKNVSLTGPAKVIFTGEILINNFF